MLVGRVVPDFLELRRSDTCGSAAPPELKTICRDLCYQHAAPPELQETGRATNIPLLRSCSAFGELWLQQASLLHPQISLQQFRPKRLRCYIQRQPAQTFH